MLFQCTHTYQAIQNLDPPRRVLFLFFISHTQLLQLTTSENNVVFDLVMAVKVFPSTRNRRDAVSKINQWVFRLVQKRRVESIVAPNVEKVAFPILQLQQSFG